MEVIKFVLKLLVALCLSTYRAYVFTLLWAWFVLFYFPGLPDLSLAGAFGLLTLVSLANFTGWHSVKTFTDAAIESILYTSTSLLIGWVVVRFFLVGA